MTGLKLLGAAAILSSALAVSAAAQEAVQEPGSLGQAHPFADYLTGGYGVHGTSRGQYGSYDGDYGMMIGPSVIVTVPNAFAYYDAPCVRGTWYVGASVPKFRLHSQWRRLIARSCLFDESSFAGA